MIGVDRRDSRREEVVAAREQRRRMRSMRRRVREYDVAHWAAAFLGDLEGAG